jgi:hypothetical protein
MNKKTASFISLLLLVSISLSACTPNMYRQGQYTMDESMLLMFTARLTLLGEQALQPEELTSATNLILFTPQTTTEEKINQLRLLADYYRYYGDIYRGQFDSKVSEAFRAKNLDLLDQADRLERRLRRGSVLQRIGRTLGSVISFAMDRAGERAQVLVESQIRATIRTFVISPRNLARGQVDLAWYRLLGPFGGNAASLLRAELFPQLDRHRDRLLAQADRLPDFAGDLENEILNGNSAPRSDRLSNSSPSEAALDGSTFETISNPPDMVNVSLWGSIPAMPYYNKSQDQYYSEEGKMSAWSFSPQNIVKWHMASSSLNEGDQEIILGNFSGIAKYYEEEEHGAYVSEGEADVIGSFRSPPLDNKTQTEITKFPFEMKFSGRVHQPNQYAGGPMWDNGKLTDQWEVSHLVYQDVEFEITVSGVMSFTVNPDNTVRMELNVSNCENSQFSSPSPGITLTNCDVQLIWDNILAD